MFASDFERAVVVLTATDNKEQMAHAAQHQAPAAAPKLLYRLRQTEDAMSLYRTMVYLLIKRGELEQVKIGDATRITAASVQALIERNKQKKAA